MNLLSFIALTLQRERSTMSPSSLDKANDCMAALRAYTGVGGCDAKEALLPRFQYDFGLFLTDRYARRYSPATAAECLRTLRKYLRVAISCGALPNIDTIPSVIDRLHDRVWTSARKPKPQAVKPLRTEIVKAVDTLMHNIDMWHSGLNKATTDDRSRRERSLQTRCAAIYLFCLLNHGIELREALTLKRPADGYLSGTYIGCHGIQLPINPDSLTLVDIYNGDSQPGTYLFATLDNPKYRGDIDSATALIEGHIIKYLKRNALPLYRHRSVLIDHINHAVARGLSPTHAEILWRTHLDHSADTGAPDAFYRAQLLYGRSHSSITENWYLVCLITPAIRRERAIAMLADSGIIGDKTESLSHIYAPEEHRRTPGDTRPGVLSRYIFVRTTPAKARFINTLSPHAYVLREHAGRSFVRIKEAEIMQLQIMLRDFPQAVELIDGEAWLSAHNASIVPGCKAIIRSGSLTGKEATVVAVKNQNTLHTTYIVEYIAGAIRFQTDLPGLDLEIVKA